MCRKMPMIKTLAHIVHKNAVEHGWWDEERNLYEVLALIHSEWSEALEEARADRPMVYKLDAMNDELRLITPADEGYKEHPGKPEGIAVELIDGVIRILDAFGYYGIETDDRETGQPASIESLWGKAAVDENVPEDVATAIALLHAYTSQVILDDNNDPTCLLGAMSLALTWVNMQGIDPLKLLMEKHQYNIGRPYKHGKKF